MEDIIAFGRKAITGARGLGQKMVGGLRAGVKIGDRLLNKLGTGVETISGIPFVGSALKPFTEVAKAGIQVGKKVLRVGERVAESGEALLRGDVKGAGRKAEEAFRKF